MWTLLLLTTALATPPRPAHTLELGAGVLPACKAEPGVADCKTVLSARAHADHRLPRGLLLVWDLIAERRGWRARDLDEVHATWRLNAAVGLGWHMSADWGDSRLYGALTVEHNLVERSSLGARGTPDEVGLDWLDPVDADGRSERWTGLGGLLGNDLDWPIGPVRLGFRYQARLDTDLPNREATAGVDYWELHALSLSAPFRPRTGPVTTRPLAAYVELGWTNQFTVPFRQPQFRVAPWLLIGLQAQWGKAATP